MDIYKVLAVISIILLLLLITVLNSRKRIVRTYNKYMKIDNKLNITGKQLAFVAKHQLELDDLSFSLTSHKLGDAYSYKYKTLIMSEDVCNTASLASLTIVAHELGHAMQHKDKSALFNTTILTGKITRLTSKLIFPLLIIGLFFMAFQYPTPDFGYIMMLISGCLFLIQVLNKILTIPLEYNASKRALKFLKENNYLTTGEHFRAKKLLGIAAQTYIASLFDELIPKRHKKRRKRK